MTYALKNVRTTGPVEDDWYEWQYDFLKDGKKVNEWYFDAFGMPELSDLRNALRLMKNVDMSFYCMDCKVHTGTLNEYYMVHDDIWLFANPDDFGMLCVSCLETRLGRMLTPADFTDAPVNGDFGKKSGRLRDRLGHGKQKEVDVS